MSISPDPPQKEQPGTYGVQNPSNDEELQRLKIQDALITTLIGNPLSEQADTTTIHRILDVGCGSGGWVCTVASAYPEMNLIGVDINPHMVKYARDEAAALGLNGRVEFQVMDVLDALEFPIGYFDLINLRFGTSFLRTWDWPKLLSDLQRICTPGGVVRITEGEVGGHCNSSAVTQLQEMLVCALFQAGHLFEQNATGLTAQLAPLLARHGLQGVQSRERVLEVQAGMDERETAVRDLAYLYRTKRPFLEKWGCLSVDYDSVYQQALDQMRDPDFMSSATLLTVWGMKPEAQ